MMLINEYLQSYEFSEFHEVEIHQASGVVYDLINKISFKKSRLINFLFAIRGLPGKMDTINGFMECGFIKLEERQGEEIVIGFLLGLGRIKEVCPDEFKLFNEGRYIKGVWNFAVSAKGNKSILSTETRVYCPNKMTKAIFSLYWFAISYFSGMTRKEMLRLIKQEAELLNAG